MINIKLIHTENEETLTLGGDLSLQNCVEIRNALNRALRKKKDVVLKLEEVTAVDLSFLQLVCSAHNTARQSNRSFSLGIPVPGVFSEFVKDSGFSAQKDFFLKVI